jgi:hypothetical protein
MPKNHIFSNCGGRRENIWGISCEKSRFYAKKSYFSPILGGGGPRAGCPPWIRPCFKAKHWKITKTLYPILSLKYLLKVRQYDWNKVFDVSFVMFNFLGDTLTLVYSQRLKIKTKYNRHLTLIRLKVVEPF